MVIDPAHDFFRLMAQVLGEELERAYGAGTANPDQTDDEVLQHNPWILNSGESSIAKVTGVRLSHFP